MHSKKKSGNYKSDNYISFICRIDVRMLNKLFYSYYKYKIIYPKIFLFYYVSILHIKFINCHFYDLTMFFFEYEYKK